MSVKMQDLLWRSLVVFCATMLAVGIVTTFSGCGQKPNPDINTKPTMPEIVRAASEAGESIPADVKQLESIIDGMNASNVESQKPLAKEVTSRIGRSYFKVKGKLEALPPLVKQEQKEKATLEKKVEQLEQADPVKAWFNLIGWVSVAGGIAAVIAGVYIGRTAIYSIGGCAAGFGLCLITIAWYIAEIRFVIGLGIASAILAGVVYVINNRKALADKAKSLGASGAAQASTPPAPTPVSRIDIGGQTNV